MVKDRHWRQPFKLLNGEVLGCSYDHPERESRLSHDEPADLALVLFDFDRPLFGDWPGSHAHRCVRMHWPTLAEPPDLDLFAMHISQIHQAVADGAVAEVFCFGGHGRTGTVLASLATLDGEAPASAIARVQIEYCARAISTSGLERTVSAIASAVQAG
jgi:hypothetical protein